MAWTHLLLSSSILTPYSLCRLAQVFLAVSLVDLSRVVSWLNGLDFVKLLLLALFEDRGGGRGLGELFVSFKPID